MSHDAVLLERVIDRTDPDASETRSEYLEIVLIAPAGRASRTEHFDLDDLAAAIRRFDELTGDGTRNAAARAHHDSCVAFFIEGDVDAMARGWSEDVVIDDRRAGAQVRTEGVEQNIRGWEIAAGVFQTLEFECLASFGARLALCRLRLVGTRPLANEQHVLSVVEVDDRGRSILTVMFEVGQLDDARACFDELAAGHHTGAAPAGNTASEVFAFGVEMLGRGDLSGLEANDRDLEFRDNLRLPWPDGGLPEATAMLASYANDGWTWTTEPVGVVDDRFAVVRASLHAPGGDERLDMCVSLVLAESGGGFRAVSVFEPEDLRLAFADCRRRWLADDPELSAASARVYDIELAGNEQTHGAIETLVAPDFSFEDHRPGSVFEGIGREEWIDLQEATLAGQPNGAAWVDVLDARGTVVLTRTCRWTEPAVVEPNWTWVQLSEWSSDGVRRLEVFDQTQLAEAEARFAELVDRVPATNLAVEAVGRWREALNANDMERFSGYFHPDVSYDTSVPLATPAGSAGELPANLGSVAEEGWEWSGAPVAIAEGPLGGCPLPLDCARSGLLQRVRHVRRGRRDRALHLGSHL